MQALFLPSDTRTLADHPKYEGVKIAVLVTSQDSPNVSVAQLEIAPGVEIPVHTHDPQLDSILVLSGQGEISVNGAWQKVVSGDYVLAPSGAEHGVRNSGSEPLRLFVHHSPPLI
jgi:quercetin dioxygenase-like cupin family protein